MLGNILKTMSEDVVVESDAFTLTELFIALIETKLISPSLHPSSFRCIVKQKERDCPLGNEINIRIYC